MDVTASSPGQWVTVLPKGICFNPKKKKKKNHPTLPQDNSWRGKGVCFQLSLLKILGAVKVRVLCFQEQLCGPNNSKLAQVEEAEVLLQVVS